MLWRFFRTVININSNSNNGNTIVKNELKCQIDHAIVFSAAL